MKSINEWTRMNKKGTDAPSFIFAIVLIASIAIVLFLFSDLFFELYGGFSDFLEDSTYTEANETINQVIQFEESNIWDFMFLAILMGYILALAVLSFQTPSNPWFFAIFIIIGMIGLFVGVAMSNTWEAFSEAPALQDTLVRFPITDTIMNNFYPLVITIIGAMIMIMLFGKRFIGGGLDG